MFGTSWAPLTVLHHPSHLAAEPIDFGVGTGLVHCRNCGSLLSSDNGPSTSRRAYASCIPISTTQSTTVRSA